MPPLAAAPFVRSPKVRALAAAPLAVGLEFGRVLGQRQAGWSVAAMVLGGAGMCLLGLLIPRGSLDWQGWWWKAAAGLALAALLLLPAAARGFGLPGVPLALAAPVALVAAGEEVAFRGAVYAALDEVLGPAAAVAGSAALFTAAHVISHPAPFLLPVAALGLLLGLWRWAFRDLVAPITAHVLADLAL